MIRKAKVTDVEGIHRILKEHAHRGELLPRALSDIYDDVRDFSLFEEKSGGPFIGVCALHVCWEDLAEIRSLAVHPEHRNKKIGARLVEAALLEAESFKITQVFTLTYQAEFFKKYGFSPIEKNDLPLKIWGDCLTCVKFPNCDETAMMKRIG